MTPEENFEFLELVHQLTAMAQTCIDKIDEKVEEASTDTVEVRVDGLLRIHTVLSMQSGLIRRLVEMDQHTQEQLNRIAEKASKYRQ